MGVRAYELPKGFKERLRLHGDESPNGFRGTRPVSLNMRAVVIGLRRELRRSSTIAVCLLLWGTACSASGSSSGELLDAGSGSSSGASGATGSSSSTSSSSSGGGSGSSSSSSGASGSSGGTSTSSSSGTTGTSSGGSSGDGGGTIGPNAGCKRGVAMPQSTPPSGAFLGDGGASGVSWWYDWGPTGSGQPAAIEFDPMIWSPPLPDPSKLPHAQYLLTFNEPDNGSQSNVSPSNAASLWPQIESIATTDGIPNIVSPAVASSVSWMQGFFSACTGCKIDYVAVHFYGCLLHTSGQWMGLAEYLAQFYPFNKPIWLTEFSCDAGQSVAAQTNYMQAAVPYLESDSHVFRYSWFSHDEIKNGMLTNGDNGPLNALGQLYVSLPASCTTN